LSFGPIDASVEWPLGYILLKQAHFKMADAQLRLNGPSAVNFKRGAAMFIAGKLAS
jgi:hypothetical protein